ncbi:thiamine pyrophosphate-dependent enzyme [Herbidospora mongoliensis]|uniref:thiamine pyrophosphate-dependent enzyme n=1 Tax=Herbidospora mongoliensis TaxID=688067 RepID=UPI00082EAB34|nr:thiamine pyrophosphate-dependent enzyme [Herbidospora mongoliensis]
MRNVADDLVQVLVDAGVTRVYGLVGDSLNAFTDAVRRSGTLEWVHVHNEEAAAFAASAEAQLTGRLAVCAGSCGPGNTHLIQGIMDAHRSEAPVLAIASHIVSREIGTGFFQETDPKALFRQTAHYCEEVAQPEQLAPMAMGAIAAAVGHRGAAVLVVPGDVLADASSGGPPTSAPAAARPKAAPSEEAVEQLAGRIRSAKKIMIFAGIGCTGARKEVLELAGRVNAPIGHTMRGKELLQWDNPYDVGMTGLLGYGACTKALDEADLILMLGTDFPYRDFLPGRDTVQVDLDPARLGRRTPLVQGIAADVGLTLRALLDKLEPREDRSFLKSMLKVHDSAIATGIDTGSPIHPDYVTTVVDEIAAEDAIFTVDTGMCCTWAARHLTPNGRRRLLGSFKHGSMANALPMAIGAQFAEPGRQVVSLSGDGGLAMLLGELLTLKTHKLPVKVVVYNNSSLGMVRLEMLVAGDPPFGTDHDMVDYAAIAAAMGFATRRVTDPDDLPDAVREVFAHRGPAVLDVVTTPDALSIPPHVTAEQAKGFALSMGKVVLDGGFGEALRMARVNLR